MDKRFFALLAAFFATSIYGLNHTIAKVIMPDYIGAFGLVLLRVVGASFLFWGVSIFFPKEKIDRKDWPRIFVATAFGMCANMLLFIKGLSLSTPINSSVLVTVTPIIVLILSAIFLKEKITTLKIMGIVLGFTGAITLVVYGNSFTLNAPNIPLGNLMMFGNATCFATYLVMVKPLAEKYNVVTLMKWMFPLGILLNLPITYNEFTAVEWLSLPWEAVWRMGFVVICTTFLAYLFNMYALRTLPATIIGVFTYLQPLIAIIYASLTGNDQMDLVKSIAAILVFVGVYLVTKKKINISFG